MTSTQNLQLDSARFTGLKTRNKISENNVRWAWRHRMDRETIIFFFYIGYLTIWRRGMVVLDEEPEYPFIYKANDEEGEYIIWEFHWGTYYPRDVSLGYKCIINRISSTSDNSWRRVKPNICIRYTRVRHTVTFIIFSTLVHTAKWLTIFRLLFSCNHYTSVFTYYFLNAT